MKYVAHFRNLGLLFLFCFILISCGSRNIGENQQNLENLKSLIEDRNFEVENQWAIPLRGNRINLIGNPNYIRFHGDSVDLFLPYFGVRHSGGGYNREGGIKYEGLAENLEVREGKNGKSMMIQFQGDKSSENFEFIITLFPNFTASTSVSTSQRDAISYQGRVKEYESVINN